MFQDAYVKCDRLETEDLLKDFAKYLEGASFQPDTSVIMTRPLPYYPGYSFYDIADHATLPARRRFVLRKGDQIIPLDFTNGPIYALNESVPLLLDDTTLLDYVRFFFSFVRGRHGRFILCESVDDIAWRDEPPPSARKAIGKMLDPLTLVRRDEDGTAHLSAEMMFRDTLFHAEIAVTPQGMVKLSNEKLLVEDMPVLEDSFGQ